EVATGRELHTIDLGPRALMTHILNSSFAFNSDGSSLFSVRTGTLKEWDTRTGRQIRAADLNQGADFGMVCFSADARLLATTKLTRRSVAVWDVASERMLHELKVGEDLTFALSPDGRVLAINHEQGNEQENAYAKQGFGKKLGRIIGVPGMNQEMVGVRRDVLTLLDTAT